LRLAVDVDAPHAHAAAFRQDDQLVAGADGALEERSRNDGTEPLARKGAVNGEARRPVQRPVRGFIQHAVEGGNQGVESRSGDGADRHDRRAGEEGSGHGGGYVFTGEGEHVGVHDVRFRQCDESPLDAEQFKDGQVFARLRHYPFVGGDDQKRDVNADHAGDHLADEPLVSRDVDEAHPLAAGQGEMSVTRLDGDLALLFLLEPVGVDAGKRFGQRRLAVVDVAGDADQPVGCVHQQPSFRGATVVEGTKRRRKAHRSRALPNSRTAVTANRPRKPIHPVSSPPLKGPSRLPRLRALVW
jgi:hypothetical protein